MQAHDPGIFSDMVVFLTTAAIIVPLVARAKVSPVLGFLLAGFLLGPHALGSFVRDYPALDWVAVTDSDKLAIFGELGIVFLLFLVGLELPIQRLVTMRKLVFGLGGAQVALSAVLIGAAASLFGAEPGAATIIGLSLALSSTAIVVEVLAQRQRLRTATGRTSFSILLLQDLAVVPLLLLVSILKPGGNGSVLTSIALAFGQAALAIGFIVVVGTALLRPLFRLVTSSQNLELFVAATLLVAVGSGLLTESAGLSMALGAFVTGLLLAETEFRRAIETAIDPFKGLLLGLFFFTVGMSIEIKEVVSHPLSLIGAVIGLIVVKGIIVAGLMRVFEFRWPAAIESAFLLGPAGEFAFIVLGMATVSGLIASAQSHFLIAVVSISMALIPILDVIARKVSRRFNTRIIEADPALAALPSEDQRARAIVVGYGRVGQLVSDMLDRHRIAHVITERQPKVVSEARAAGRPVFFGDGRNTQFLTKCGLMDAHAVIITMHTWPELDELVSAIRSMRPKIVIVARARDAEHARHLYEIGVTDAVPETIEASLQLSEAALVGLGVPAGPVIASIHEKRDEFREVLQGAVKEEGRTSLGVKAKAPSLDSSLKKAGS